MIDHLADLKADFRVFYRIDDIYRLDGPEFFSLAWRVSAYGGVMKLRLERQADEVDSPQAAPAQSPGPRTGTPKTLSGVPVAAGADVVPLDSFMILPGAVGMVDIVAISPDGAQ